MQDYWPQHGGLFLHRCNRQNLQNVIFLKIIRQTSVVLNSSKNGSLPNAYFIFFTHFLFFAVHLLLPVIALFLQSGWGMIHFLILNDELSKSSTSGKLREQ